MFAHHRLLIAGLMGAAAALDGCAAPGVRNSAAPGAASGTAPGSQGELRPAPGRPWRLELAAGSRLEMVWIPAGNFRMGSPASEARSGADERPQTQVALSQGFWLGQTVFTIGQWKAVTGLDVRGQLMQVIRDDTLYDLGGKKQTVRDFMRFSATTDPGQYLAGEGDDLPMYFVSWNDAMGLGKTLTERERAAGRLPAGYAYTLPTEAQFEYACRAGTTTATYAVPLEQIAWYSGNSAEGYTGRGFNVGGRTGGPHGVGQKQPNAWGLYDMSGDIWQWCRDYYGPLPGGSVTDPSGPASGTERVNRAGSFGSGANSERSAARAKNPPAEASAYRGFRLALCPVP